MSPTLRILILVSVTTFLISVRVLSVIYYWHHGTDTAQLLSGIEQFIIGSLFTTVIGFLTVVIAILIYREQKLSQETFQREQKRVQDQQLLLQEQLRDRVFGVMGTFEKVYSEIVRLIKDANNTPDSKLAIMMYWLWFGIDQRFYENTTVPIYSLRPNDSEIRSLLIERMNRGRDDRCCLPF